MPRPAAPGVVPVSPPSASGLHIHDILAAGRRLWVRGRLDLPSATLPTPGRAWWRPWIRVLPAPPAPTVRVETAVSGETLVADVPLRPDGTFDACFDAPLPPARRGWRVARNQITFGEQTLRACGVALEPPADATAATALVMPLQYTLEPGGVQGLTRWPLAARLADLFWRQPAPAEPNPVYYLAAVPVRGRNLQPELALAATSVHWPAGPFVLVPTDTAAAAGALAAALDRLRWLLAGRLELLVVNTEPRVEGPLLGAAKEAPDRATLSRFVRAEEDVHDDPSSGLSAPRLLPRRSRSMRHCNVPRHPLVFCHGMLAMTMLRMQMTKDTNYYVHLQPFLAQRGVEALFPGVEPTGGVVHRAEQLRDQICRWTDEPVNIIAHSMGGLDARFLITRLGMADRVKSLTTISAPHRGSALADWFCLNYRQRVPLLLTLEAMGFNVDGFTDCRPRACQEFNERTPDVPGVRYFSYTAAVMPPRITPMLRRGWSLLRPLEGPNDGIVSVQSSRWGEVAGHIAVDHFAQTPDGLFVRPDETFDTLGFYGRLIEDLGRRGL
jgi:triacylglycerol lipase